VLPGQLEPEAIVIEGGPSPLRGVVTALASLRKARLDVVRTRGGLKLRQVAGNARRRQRRVLTVGMALVTRDGRVLPG
jgi:hypothetical protein